MHLMTTAHLMTDNNYVAVIGGSFRDPTSRVYALKETGTEHPIRILRGLNENRFSEFKELFVAPFYKRLIQEQRVIGTFLPDSTDPAVVEVRNDGWVEVLEHDVVPFVTYPYEWSFGMLRQAALLYLRVLEDALSEGWTLRDATPFNIQFVGAQPVFIDIPSFEPRVEGAPWVGYRQFCSLFLTPLLLRSYLGIDHSSILRACIDGLPPSEARKYFRGLSRFRKGVLSHVVFPAIVEDKISKKERDDRMASSRVGRPQSTPMVLGLVQSLTRLVKSLKINLDHSDWSHYAQTNTYDASEHDAKAEFVRNVCSSRLLGVSWDLGCNTGTFSRILADRSELVLALDGDHNAIETLFRSQLGADRNNILPVVMNLANFSPAQGWAGIERMSFDERRKPDLVLALALIHHLRITANIPIDMFLDWLVSLQSEVVIEFVDRHDEMVEKLLTNKSEDYPDYTKENFLVQVKKRFSIADRVLLKGGKREIFHLVRL